MSRKIMYDDYLILTNNSLSTQYYYGLVNGEVGLMVSSGYFYHLYNDDIYFDQCSSLLDMLVKKHRNEFSLGYGLAGLAWGIMNSATGEMIYSVYTPLSYNIKSDDLKDLQKKISKS